MRAAAPASFADKTTGAIDDRDLWGGKTAALLFEDWANAFRGVFE